MAVDTHPETAVEMVKAERISRGRQARIIWAITMTLTLAIMGGAQLVQASNFASTGAIAGTLLLTLVAIANTYTSRMLFQQAYFTGRRDYEKLGYAVGGRIWQLCVEISVFVLLFGTLITVIQQVGEIWGSALLFFNPDISSVWTNGRLLMLFSVILCIPFIFMNNLLILEKVGSFTVIIVAVSAIWVMVVAIQRGMPYIGQTGQFETVGFTSLSAVLACMSSMGFGFYIQPIAMPILTEVPAGRVGVRCLTWGTTITIMGTAWLTYWVCGFFGAALSGAAAVETGNFLQDDLGNPTAQGILNMFNVVYLIVSIPPFEFGTRHAVDSFLMSFFKPNTENKFGRFLQTHYRLRQAILASLLYASTLGLAVAFPGKSAKVITITGAVGVGLVSYLIPCINHFVLYFGVSKAHRFPKEVVQHEKLVRESMQAAELTDVDLPMSTAVTAPPEGLDALDANTMDKPPEVRDSALDMVNEKITEEDVEKVEQNIGRVHRSFVNMRQRMYRKKTQVDLSVVPEDTAVSQAASQADRYIVGGATDYLYPHFRYNKSPLDLLRYVVVPLVVLTVGGFVSIGTLVTLE